MRNTDTRLRISVAKQKEKEAVKTSESLNRKDGQETRNNCNKRE